MDASLLQMAGLRLLAADDPRLTGTIEAIRRSLSKEGWLFRYRLDDGFGQPTVAFVICTFWLAEALAIVGRREDAKNVLEYVSPALSPLGLLSEDYDPTTLRMWGNFPAGVPARGPHPRRIRGFSEVVGGFVSSYDTGSTRDCSRSTTREVFPERYRRNAREAVPKRYSGRTE